MDEKNFGAASLTAKTVAHELSVPGSVADRKTAHTAGPWSADVEGAVAVSIEGADGTVVCDVHGASDDPRCEANAARIVACVNACEEMKDPAKEVAVAVAAFRAHGAAVRERDEAREKLQRMENNTKALDDCRTAAKRAATIAENKLREARAQRDELAAALLAAMPDLRGWVNLMRREYGHHSQKSALADARYHAARAALAKLDGGK